MACNNSSIQNDTKILHNLRLLCTIHTNTIHKQQQYDTNNSTHTNKPDVELILHHSLEQLNLGARLPVSTLDESSIMKKLFKWLIQTGRERDTPRLSQLKDSLTVNLKDPIRRAACLTLLFNLLPDPLSTHRPITASFNTTNSLLSLTPIPAHSSTKQTMDYSTTAGESGYQSFKLASQSSTLLQSQIQQPSFKRRSLLSTYEDVLFSNNLRSNELTNNNNSNNNNNNNNNAWELTEHDLVRDLVCIFQGVDGIYIKWYSELRAYKVHTPNYDLPPPILNYCSKLAELGLLFRFINNYVNTDEKKSQKVGIIVQSLKAALKDHMFEYYRFISVLDDMLHREVLEPQTTGETPPLLSLRRLVVWTYEPMQCFRLLATLVHHCQNLNGGKLMNKIYEFSRTGHPEHAKLLKGILNKIFSPFKTVLNRWLYEGELPSEENYYEFFIKQSSTTFKTDELWEHKFTLRKEHIPAFMSDHLAHQVLITGKSIDFLKERCGDHHPKCIPNLDEILKMSENETFESLIDGTMQIRIKKAYEDTSKYVISVLNDKFELDTHIKAIRRYLLLGQGDFIRMLMGLLFQHLENDARQLLLHNLITLMMDAIRATNARFEPSHIIERLDINLLKIMDGDQGWDVFCLSYRTDGPLQILFTNDVMILYKRIFNFIWRAKRTEFSLTKTWQDLMKKSKIWSISLNLEDVFHLCCIISSALIHITHQMQYFLSFEVLECSWAELQKDLNNAFDIDFIRKAHMKFLSRLCTSCFLQIDGQSDKNLHDLLLSYRNISEDIVKFVGKLEEFYKTCDAEQNLREKYYQANCDSSPEIEEMEQLRRAQFNQNIQEHTLPDLKILHSNCFSVAAEFIRLLRDYPNPEFKYLSARLNFNEFFKYREKFK